VFKGPSEKGDKKKAIQCWGKVKGGESWWAERCMTGGHHESRGEHERGRGRKLKKNDREGS